MQGPEAAEPGAVWKGRPRDQNAIDGSDVAGMGGVIWSGPFVLMISKTSVFILRIYLLRLRGSTSPIVSH